MPELLWVSNIVLWIVVLALLVAVYALARQIGVLHERVAPVGALMPMNGPRIGETITPLAAPNLEGESIQLGEASDTRTLFFFLSPGCPVCKSLIPVVRELPAQEGDLTLYFASDGESLETHQRYAEEQQLPLDRYLLSTELGLTLGVNKLPFAALLGPDGAIRARGLVNSREHLESLMAADEMDVSSLQEYLDASGNDRNR